MTTSPAWTLDSATFQKIQPLEYMRRFILNAESSRPDGRKMEESRPVAIRQGTLHTTLGSSQVKIGDTLVVCGIKAQVAPPRVQRPREGYLVPNIELPPLCSSKFKPGPPGEMTQTLSHYLNMCIEKSGFLDLSQLSIEPGVSCWVLYADILCMNYDGNVLDAAFLALVAALLDVQLPRAIYNEQDRRVHASSQPQDARPLTFSYIPISITLSVFDGQVVDPTDQEEDVASGTICLVCHVSNTESDQVEWISIVTLGAGQYGQCLSVSKSIMSQCFDVAKKQAIYLKSLLISQ